MGPPLRYDWLKANPPPPKITPYEEFMRNFDWASTAFGPIESWSPELCRVVRSMIADVRPSALWWGTETYHTIYNEPYTQLVGTMHPALLGAEPKDHFHEAWPYFHDVIIRVRETGRAISGGGQHVAMRRHGYNEETYFDWQYAPVFGDDGTVLGVLDTAFETTIERLAERRLSTTIKINTQIGLIHRVDGLWAEILRGLEYNPMDVPMAVIYSLHEDDPERRKLCVLEGAIGIPENHAAIPSKIDYLEGNDGFVSLFRLCAEGDEPLHLAAGDDRMQARLLDGIHWHGHGIPSTDFVVSPIRTGRLEEMVAFILIGLNPMRLYDGAYQHFVQSIIKQIVTPRISAVMTEEEVQKGRIAAAKAQADRERISRELLVKTKAHEQAEMKFTRFADNSVVALCIANPDGSIAYANQAWHDLHYGVLDQSRHKFWLEAYLPEDAHLAEEAFARLTKEMVPISYQARMKLPWTSPPDLNGHFEVTPTWVLCTAYPELNPDGSLYTLFGTMTDISAQKYQEAQILATTNRVLESETKWSRFVDKAPVGICHLDPQGMVVTANEAWYNLMGYEKDRPLEKVSWRALYHDDEFVKIDKAWDELFQSKAAVVLELQLKKPWSPLDPAKDSQELHKFRTWTLNSAYVEADEEGRPKYVIVCIIDITNNKYAELLQKRRMEDVLENKRQQESFIDMTSHEMRNPLSAMQFSADEITTSLQKLLLAEQASNGISTKMLADSHLTNDHSDRRAILESCVDAAQTITYCTQHQKRIVDDILVMSRLDSNLLLITPVAVQPTELVRNGLHVFGGELASVDVKLDYHIEPSMQDLFVDWVMLDPSRVLQVLINFVTNSIKFTRTEARRNITVKVGASLDRPKEFIEGFHFFPSRSGRDDITLNKDWGLGEVVWLYFIVQDTGRGLNDEEKKVLFMRFSQSSPRTHVKYGGSGLGLFISRQLTEMQGGEIGVASDAGKGSTFAFYIKSRRTTPPDLHTADLASPIDQEAIWNGQLGAQAIHPEHNRVPLSISSPTNFSPSEVYILVVEDNLVNQKVLQKQLRSRGFNVDVANHGEEALDYLEQTEHYKGRQSDASKLSVILMDWEMPVMDGIECVKEIRKLEAAGTLRKHIPVIAVTANVRSEQIETAMKAGMDAVTTKPFQIGQIMSQIEQVLKDN